MDHTEAIVQINNLIDDKFCNEMIKIINERAVKKMTIGNTSEQTLDKNIRNVFGFNLSYKEDEIIYKKINSQIEKLYTYYKAKFLDVLENKKINQIDLLKYEVGGKYDVHTDTMTDGTRNVSVIINLNNDYKGGELFFTNPMKVNQKIKNLKLGKGSIVFFPGNFMYPHGIELVTEGTRYSIVAWLQ